MPQPEHLDPAAYAADGGPVGVLLIHGLSGSVVETRPMGEYLSARGLTVRCPLLPGHGTTPEELTRIHRQAWIDEVASALSDLQSRCQTVFVGGLSMGALLALWLGAQYPESAGLILMAPAIKFQNQLAWLALGTRYLLKYPPPGFVPEERFGDPEAIQRIWCYDVMPLQGAAEMLLLLREVHQALPRIRQPVLIFQGRLDNYLSPQAAQIVHDGVSSTDKTLVWLENSGHNLLVDGERESAWARSYAWLMERAAPAAG